MKNATIIPLDCLAAHGDAFRWLDNNHLSSYSIFGRLVIDAFFAPQAARPSAGDLARAFFNFIQESRTALIDIPDHIFDQIEEAAAKALRVLGITKDMAERQFGPVPVNVSYEIQPTASYDLYFLYESRYEPLATYPSRFADT